MLCMSCLIVVIVSKYLNLCGLLLFFKNIDGKLVDCHLFLSLGGCGLGLGFGFLNSNAVLSLAGGFIGLFLCMMWAKYVQHRQMIMLWKRWSQQCNSSSNENDEGNIAYGVNESNNVANWLISRHVHVVLNLLQ